MFFLSPRDSKIRALRLRVGQRGLRQRYVAPGGNAAVEPVDRQLEVPRSESQGLASQTGVGRSRRSVCLTPSSEPAVS